MFTITVAEKDRIVLTGRLDASQTEEAARVLATVTMSAVVDFKDLEYISSAGLGTLLAAQKRLKEKGQALKLVNLNGHVRDVFKFARFDLVFQIE
ncbi:MAG: hypothetical protein A2X67_15090 [Ignavibacteria bacterium GWA2_55_11]|nr:MAG: hypothetical protein A2X67_15090 [Ignavibacteria bacterium GWA2_55_11]OGU45324.1 MAG: hypothetical protein A2X68_02100 [Ignavibacteria bacterium GWC2_56_12]OGU65618.1 MAG: hypothetical protein A3C56_06205 [Ignavibacteria bacterium RIFCSPHIGHO2_02_FULL_56_12]OGU73579.1 MAG: hypothetical protein A3G43_00660 [Ignavibacteria bacterium RIFCSPLOWO2_12_FULL_56_21]OGU74117.1 MAG: hypothetical protein A3H45_07070 [Ignavibacteria bacterium RIFCSPLOWO2_02_FULL_55_14]HAV22263.1 anti-sigma factor a